MGFRLLIVHKSNNFTSSRHACRHCTLDGGGSDMVLLSWHRTICMNQRKHCSVEERRWMERKMCSGQRSRMSGIETNQETEKIKWNQGQVLPSCFTDYLCVCACLYDMCVCPCTNVNLLNSFTVLYLNRCTPSHTGILSCRGKRQRALHHLQCSPDSSLFFWHISAALSLFSFPPSTPKDPLVLIRQFLLSSSVQ